MRTKLLQTFVLGAAFGMVSCSSTDSPAGAGNAPGSGGSSTSAGNGSTTAGASSVGQGGATGISTAGSSAVAGSNYGGSAPSTGGSTATGGSGFGQGGVAGASTGGSSSQAGTGTGVAGTAGFSGSGQGGVGQAGSGQGGTGQAGSGQGGSGHAGSGQGGMGMAGSGQAGSGGSGGGTTVSCNGPALSGGSQHCSSNGSGTANNFTWTIWSSGTGGCMTTYNTGAAYKATWNNSGDFLAREGFQWDETKTYDQLGTISADFAYTKTGSAGGYSYIGIYGWSNNPLVEYYIVEDWYGNGPPTGGGTHKGSFTVDGAQYDVYQHTQTNQPSIHGTQTFPQFFSVRKTARQCGHISISEHFKEWGSLGMNLGKMYEAKILVEVGGGQGSIDFSAATMTAK